MTKHEYIEVRDVRYDRKQYLVRNSLDRCFLQKFSLKVI